VSEQSHLTDGW